MPKEGANFIDRLVGKGTMQQRIMKTILICVLIPMGVLTAVAILQISPLTTDIGTQGTSSISQEGINSLKSSATDAANWVKLELDQAKADLRRLVDTELSFLNGTMNITETRISYHANGTPSITAPASSRYGGLGVNFSRADWGNALSLNETMRDKVNKSAYMDYSLKGISNNTCYMTITQVFKDGISRVYPYIATRWLDPAT
jgi:hypothetical protein